MGSAKADGIAEAFVKTFKRDYVRVNALPDAGPSKVTEIAPFLP